MAENKELRKMKRSELIEIIYALQQNELSIRKEMAEMQQKLDEKVIAIEESGSIAEAAAKVNQLFEYAQATADQYNISVKAAADQYSVSVRAAAELKAKMIIEEAEKKAEEILAKVQV